MNHDLVIRQSNRVAFYAIGALLYWVFAFVLITVFDLKVFRQHLTEAFGLSVLGLLAIIGAAIALNVMSNLSKISTLFGQAQGAVPDTARTPRLRMVLLVAVFPLIAAALFGGNALTQAKKRALLIGSAQTLAHEHREALEALAPYRFDEDFVRRAERSLGVIASIDKNLPHVTLVAADSIDGKPVYLGFDGNRYASDSGDAQRFRKERFIFSAPREVREYLARALGNSAEPPRFEAHEGNYQLFYPIELKGQRYVLYFSDFQRYGKLGS